MISKVTGKLNRIFTEWGVSLTSWVPGKVINSEHFILMYHGITSKGSGPYNKRHSSIACFEKQVAFLKKNFHVIPVANFFEKRFLTGRPNVAITFDDGYLNNYIYAKPVLEKFQCPATFYVTGLNCTGDKILWADFVNIASYSTTADINVYGEKFHNLNNVYYSLETGKSLYHVIKQEQANYDYKLAVYKAFENHINFFEDSSLEEYWKLMTDEQISEVSKSPWIRIGSHGYFHNNLGSLSLSDSLHELTLSKSYLENLIQQPVNELAYPDGSYSEELVKSAEVIGFTMQLATEKFHFESDYSNNCILRRKGVYDTDSCVNQILGVL